MNAALIDILKAFLLEQQVSKKPLVLGMSGGSDSTCLFYLLLALRAQMGFELHLAHVNHSYRKQSKQEALRLADLAQKHGVAFHLMTLDPKKIPASNIEDYFRQQRLSYFARMVKTLDAQALLLAHHADDLEETVFKRFLEGASLASLYGMKPVSLLQGILVFRPLLRVKKAQILAWLFDHKLTFFQDETNFDGSNARSVFRTILQPFLQKHFGKPFSNNLIRHAEQSTKLEQYMDQQTAKFFDCELKGPWGICFDFSKNHLNAFELGYFLKQLLRKQDLIVSSKNVLELTNWVILGKANKKMVFKEAIILVDRKKFFFMRPKQIEKMRAFFHIPVKKLIAMNKVVVRPAPRLQSSQLGWKALWQGMFCFAGPNLAFDFVFRDRLTIKKTKDIKMPVFFKSIMPVVCINKQPYLDLFTGIFLSDHYDPAYSITIKMN